MHGMQLDKWYNARTDTQNKIKEKKNVIFIIAGQGVLIDTQKEDKGI